MSLTLDPPGKAKKRVGEAVRAVFQGQGPRWVVAAYVTSDEVRALSRRKGRHPKPKLLCDPFLGNCNPDVLVALATHAHVYCRANIHAKVYRGPAGVAIGSANLSAKGLGDTGYIESMAVVRMSGITAQADAWFETLRRAPGTKTLAALMADKARWAIIQAAYAAKQGRGIGGRRGRGARPRRDDRPELATALADPKLEVGALAFEFVGQGEHDLTHEQVREVADASGVEFDDKWGWTEETTDHPVADIQAAIRWEGTEIVTFYGDERRVNGAVRLYVIDEIESPTMRFVRALPGPGRRVLYLFAPCLQRFRFSKYATERLRLRLNAALKARRPAARPAADTFMSPTVIAELLAEAPARLPS